MEVREILIANTKTQKRSKIETDATTLGELKTALDNAGIDYSGMTFTEGISKTQLLDDATQLPQNVMYKGEPTNNLVILLTNTKKNISSGSDRSEAYVLIKKHNLQDVVKQKYGKNYTQVSTKDLWDTISDMEDDNDYSDDYDDEDYEKVQACTEVSKGKVLLDDMVSRIASLLAVGQVTLDDVANFARGLLGYVENTPEIETPVERKPISTSDGSINDDDIDNMIDELENL